MTYNVTLKQKVIKTLQGLNEPYYTQIKDAIYRLSDNPRPHGYTKLVGRKGYRIRVGDFRIIYLVYDDHLVVQVIDLGHRQEIYG